MNAFSRLTTDRAQLLRDASPADPAARPEPEPLRRPTPPPKPYPIAELGPILRPACEAIRRVIQAPDAVCAASLLAAASLATQGLADVRIDGRVIPLSLWLVTIAESGERKSAVDAEAMRGAHEAERELHAAYAESFAQYQREQEEWDAKRDAARSQVINKAKGVGLAQALCGVGEAPLAPLQPNMIAADLTAEGLTKLLRDGRPSVGVMSDEGGLVLGGHGMTKEAVVRTAATLCRLWGSGEIDRVRASEAAVKLYGRRVALHLLVQPVIAERALSDAILSGQGFLARCLLAWPEGTAGTRPYVSESLRENAALARFTARTRDLLQKPMPLAEGTRNELSPCSLTLTAEAKAKWIEFYNAIERREAPGGELAICKPWASKAAEQCLRVAGVLTLIEDPEAQHIELGTLERAAELASWYLNEAARLAGTAELPPEVRDAEALLQWCQATGRNYLYSGAALRLGPSRIRDRIRFIAAVNLLADSGWAHPLATGMKLDGADRRRVWEIVMSTEGA